MSVCARTCHTCGICQPIFVCHHGTMPWCSILSLNQPRPMHVLPQRVVHGAACVVLHAIACFGDSARANITSSTPTGIDSVLDHACVFRMWEFKRHDAVSILYHSVYKVEQMFLRQSVRAQSDTCGKSRLSQLRTASQLRRSIVVKAVLGGQTMHSCGAHGRKR